MKITCEACGSKYTIADEKVQGKRVKVRCKNCGGSIVVNGAESSPDLEGAAGEALEAPVLDSGESAPKAPTKKNAWSVNLSDDDSRDMTTDELVQGWKDGLVTQDAYVWKDGMGDWKPILEVPELKAKLTVVRPKAEGVVTSTKRGPSAAAPDDLFGGGGGVDVNVGDDDKKPTGARNESSVLFSLDALKAPGASGAKVEEKKAAEDLFGGLGGGFGGGLGGGVLGTNTDLLTAPAKDPPPAPVGARPVAPVATALPEAKKSSTGLIAAAAILALGALGGGYLMMSSKSDEDPAKIAAEAAAKAEREAKEAAAAEIQKAKDAAAAELKKKEEELAKALAAGQKAPEPAKSAEPEPAKPTTSTTPAATAAAAATTAKPATTTAPTTETPKPAAAAAAFDAGAAKSALTTAAANAASCGTANGPTGAGKVEVTFAPSGRVTSANVVSGPFGGTPVGGCIASTFRKARVPAFSGDPVTVSKSFRIN